MNTQSNLKVTVVINASHDGETIGDITQTLIKETIKEGIIATMREDDSDLPINVTVYVQTFEYKDNIEANKRNLIDKINKMSADDFADFMRDN